MSQNECPLTSGRIRARHPGAERKMLSVVLTQQQRRWPLRNRERRNGQLSPMFAAWAVTEKLHRPAFKRCVRPLHNCRHFFSHKQLDIVEWGCGDAQNSGERNPRHGALQRMARNRGHHGGRSSNLRSSIRKQHPDLRVRHWCTSSAILFGFPLHCRRIRVFTIGRAARCPIW
jgi:hypothetical protein